MPRWFVYILECADKTLYTGITPDPERRLLQHNAGKGAKYTKGRRPVRLVYKEDTPGKSEAARRECAIKKLKKAEKRILIDGWEMPEIQEIKKERP